MTDLFEGKDISPMLLRRADPFDNPDYIFELKFDGARCIAYLDAERTVLRNKRNRDVTNVYPELGNIFKCAKKRCILDGELVVLKNGKPDFSALQRRSLTEDRFKIKLAARKNPAQFVAFDILYIDGRDITGETLIDRKKILAENVTDGYGLALSRYVEGEGKAFFGLAEERGLEGIVAKKKDGRYHVGRRTGDWVKIKVLAEEDFLVCGYTPDEKGGVGSLILGSGENGELRPRGKVYAGAGSEERKLIKAFAEANPSERPPFFSRYGKETVWMRPELAGTVVYMPVGGGKGLRRPVWKGLKE